MVNTKPRSRKKVTAADPMSVREAARLSGSAGILITEPVLSLLSRAARWELAHASKAVAAAAAETPNSLDRSSGLDDLLTRFDAARSLLDRLRAGADAASVTLDPHEHARLVLRLLRAELRFDNGIQDAVRRERLYQDQRRVGQRIRALKHVIAMVADAIVEETDRADADRQLVGWPLSPIAPSEEILRKLVSLTPRETEVLSCLSRDKRPSEIAAILRIDVETVRWHARKVRHKLGIRTNRDLVGMYIPKQSHVS